MSPEKLVKKVSDHLQNLEPYERWLQAVKYYFAYFLTVDEITQLAAEHRLIFQTPESFTHLKENLSWFQQFGEYDDYDKLMDSQRPIVWDIDVLNKEFGEEFVSFFVYKEKPDYSVGEKKTEEVYQLDWMEEYGFIATNRVMFSRTIQTVVIENQVSEYIVLALPKMNNQMISETMNITTSVGGGITLKEDFAPSHLNINYGDTLGIDGVDTVMCMVDIERFGMEAEPYVRERRAGHPLIG